MIPQITDAFSKGFDADQILKFLLKKFPQHKSKIQNAITAGFLPNQILDFLTGGMKQVNKNSSVNTEYAQTRQQDIQKRENINKTALGAGALAATSLAAPMAAAALQHALPNDLLGQRQNDTEILRQGKIQTPEPQTSSVDLIQEKEINQTNISPIKIEEILNNTKSKERIDALLKSGNGPQEISGFFEKFASPLKKEIEKQTGMSFDKVIEDYISTIPKESIQEGIETPQQVQINEIVATPHGAGEVKAIRNGKAIVDINGRKHQVNEDQLIQSPISEKDLGELYEDLLSGIELKTGEDVSRNVNWAGYDPITNELAYRPHNGRLYVYNDISPEDVEELTSILSKRKTTGENFIGAWKQGSKSPIGAAMYKLIRKLQEQRGGKGNEYKNRFETVYDALEPAVTALKKKKKKQ